MRSPDPGHGGGRVTPLARALEWTRAKGGEFVDAHDRILAGRERAASWARGLPAGTQERADAGRTVQRWSDLLADHSATWTRWNRIARRVPGLEGLGVVPVVLPAIIAAGVIAVAGSMAVILRKLTAEERALRLLERGRITPAQAIELAANIEGGRAGLFGGAVPGWLIPAAAVAGLYVYARSR